MEMHSFNTKIAQKYGIVCAILLQNLFYWTEKNKANNVHFHDGYYWTYNSNKAFEELFPYLSGRQIKYALDSLEENGLIKKGNYNKSCDRTLWYAVTEKAISILNGIEIEEIIVPETEEVVVDDDLEEETMQSINDFIDEQNAEIEDENMQNCQNELTNLSNGNIQNCQMEMTKLSNVPNNKQQIVNTNNIEKEIHKEKETTEDPVVSVFEFWNSKNLMKCEELTHSLRNIIKSTLKSNKLDEIKLYISRYDEVLNNPGFYLEHKWSLKSFICQPNAMNEFKDKGEKWVNYQSWKSKSRDNTGQQGFIHNSYTEEQIKGLISNLDEVTV